MFPQKSIRQTDEYLKLYSSFATYRILGQDWNVYKCVMKPIPLGQNIKI